MNFDYDITEVFFSQESDQQYSSIGSDEDLAPGTRQAIIWTNDAKFTDIYASLGFKEFTVCALRVVNRLLYD